MADVDWAALFASEVALLEIFIRGTVVYLVLFGLLRFTIKREAGTLGLTDLLVIVLLADAAQNAMSNGYRSITDGLVLILTIVGWSYMLDFLAFRYAFWRRVVRPPRIQLIADGRLLWRNLKKEKITEEELMSEIRNHGFEDLGSVQAAYIESDGMISVIAAGGRAGRRQRRGRGLGA